MLTEIFPRAHARYASLRVLGPHLAGFTAWLHEQGYPIDPIRMRVRAAARLDARLRRRGVRAAGDLTAAQWHAFAPKDSQHDIGLAALVRSFVLYLENQGLLAKVAAPTRRERLVAQYRAQLNDVRGLAGSTVSQHCGTAGEFLRFVGFERRSAGACRINRVSIDDFVRHVGGRVARGNLQHKVAQLRSFLRFLYGRGEAPQGLDTCVDTPRLYRGEQLPCALPWETVQAFLPPSTARARRADATTRCSCSSLPMGYGSARSHGSRWMTSSGAPAAFESRGRR